jgi:secreted PhoX family phosphatase
MGTGVSRRAFLIRSAAAGTAVGGAHVLGGLLARAALAADGTCSLQAAPGEGSYGPLEPAGPELALPAGFTYRKFGVTGALMSDGHLTPTAHDGMAAFALKSGHIRLVRNHEIPGLATPGLVTLSGDVTKGYDPGGQGGTTSLEIKVMPSGERRLVSDFVSLSGTIMNCAGGPTPWGSWISCEETTQGGEPGLRKPHGYCFEVPARARAEVPAVPLVEMGRFVHEAVAVDPATGFVYETEDRSSAGLYRFIPRQAGDLAQGGRLQALAIAGQPNYDTSVGQQAGVTLPVTWIDIADPDPSDAEANPSAVFDQGYAQGASRFRRLEGCWFGADSLFFNSTSGGDAGLGQVWQYRPRAGTEGELTLFFESESVDCLDGPDNITVSPRGGVLVCEDGGGQQYLRGLTPEGKVFDFALNLATMREFAGATFSPDGETLFVNIQGDVTNQGMTLAIWGPWETGAL